MSKISPLKINNIAAEYLTNGGDKVKALVSTGYKLSYAQHYYNNIFSNIQLKAEIDRLRAKTELKTDITIAKIQAEHLRLQQLAEQKGDLSTATANLIANGKTIGAYTDRVNSDVTEHKAIEDSEKEALEAAARAWSKARAV